MTASGKFQGAPTLNLHIGAGKAGSTAIQSALKQAPNTKTYSVLHSAGGASGWKIAASSATPEARDYWVNRQKRLTHSEFNALQKTLWRDVQSEVNRKPIKNFVASGEHIYAQYKCDLSAIETLSREVGKIFSNVHIVFYLRDQRDWIPSFYAQAVKGPTKSTETYEEFISRMNEYRHMWDYHMICRSWAQVFGSDNLSVTLLHDDCLVDGSLIADFAQKIGSSADEFFASSCDRLGRVNASPHPLTLRVLRRLNAYPKLEAACDKKELLRRFVIKIGRLAGQKKLNSFDAYIVRNCSESNARLNEHYLNGSPIKLPVWP